MSRSTSATPPAAYFPQRTSTPTLRHNAPPGTASAAAHSHFRSQPHQHSPEKRAGRRIKHLPPSLGGLKARKQASASVSLDEGMEVDGEMERPGSATPSDTGSASGSASPSPSPPGSDSYGSSHSIISGPSTSLNTPAGTDASSSFSLQQYPDDLDDFSRDASDDIPRVAVIPSTPANVPTTSATRSWVPHFGLGKVKAVLPTFPSWSVSADKRKKALLPLAPIEVPVPVVWEVCAREAKEGEGVFSPQARALPIPADWLIGLDEEAVKKKKREWAEGQHLLLTECARLCSQWPQSGYNTSKWGPNGAKHYYEPQSYGNPTHVQEVMVRQSQLEADLLVSSGLFYPSSHSRSHSRLSTSTTDSEDSESIYNSALPSPTASVEVAQELRAAMGSPLLGYTSGASLVSLLLPPMPECLKSARSLSELNRLAQSMILSRTTTAGTADGERMEIDTDTETSISLNPSVVSLLPTDESSPSTSLATSALLERAEKAITRPARAQSCGSKRPLSAHIRPPGASYEEEKRRKVDEAAVVSEAVSSGVIVPPPPSSASSSSAVALSSSSSTPASTGVAEVFGHVVKTSDTHPIIISPFFPTEMLEILRDHMIPPPPGKTVQLKSGIDVPALLLSQAHGQAEGPAGQGTVVPSPVGSSFWGGTSNSVSSKKGFKGEKPKLGNLLLSSCPGKRLRMGGPVKGRGPVCRDLKTDLGRIKAEGVGCLVCCLDDAELLLLGTPWETYRDVANELGLDVVRLPMPDGFTPSSLALFDTQVSRICSGYTLKGVNVLVHCRGGVGRAGVTACAWAIKMGFVQPHPSLVLEEETAKRQTAQLASLSAAPAPASAPMAVSTSSSSGKSMIPFFSQRNYGAIAGTAPPTAVSTSSSLITATPVPAVPAQSTKAAAELEHQIVMSIVERAIAMIRSRRGLKAIESFEQVQFLKVYVGWLRGAGAGAGGV